MKRYQISIFLPVLFLLFGAGCTQNNITINSGESDSRTSTANTNSNEVTDSTERPSSVIDRTVYKQWALSKEFVEMHKLDFKESKKDCIDIYNGDTEGKDLLSTLIVDDTARALMPLEVYTPEYVQKIEKKIAENFKQKTKNDFYAFKVCHVGDEVDVVAGYQWPHGVSTLTNAGTVARDFKKNGAVVIVNGASVLPYFNLPLLDATVTGGEVAPCKATLESKKLAVKWSCFVSVNKPAMTEEKRNYWLLPLNENVDVKTGTETVSIN